MKTGMIILNYNDVENTLNMVKQVRDYKSLFKIVIVDNCSTESIDELRALESDKIVLLEAHENLGYGAGNNLGLRYLEKMCDLVFITNPDIVVSFDVVDGMIEVMENKNISFLGPSVREHGKVIRGWKLPSYFVEVLSTINFFSRYARKFQFYKDDHYQSDLTQVDAIHGSFFLARMKDFFDIGYFDENTFLYYEENIIGKKAKDRGLSIYVSSSLFVTHALSLSVDKSLNKVKKYKILKKSMFYYEKKYNKRSVFSLLFLKFVYYVSLVVSYLTFFI